MALVRRAASFLQQRYVVAKADTHAGQSTPEEDARVFDPAILSYYWGPVVRFMADAHDIELDEIRFFREFVLSDSSFETSGGLSIKPGGGRELRRPAAGPLLYGAAQEIGPMSQ